MKNSINTKKNRLIPNNIIARNKNLYLYTIIKEYVAGIQLKGTEVKAIIVSSIDINNAFVLIKNNESYLFNSAISHWKNASHNNHEIRRTRKLLLNKKEIIHMHNYIKEKGCTIIATHLIRKNGKFKLKIAIVKKKKLFDKREKIKKRIEQREKKNLYY